VFEGLHHAQLAMPPDEEDTARGFFVGVLGMAEIAKPPVLAARGGAWFRAGGLELHLGVEEDFRPARKGHPGILVSDLDRLVERLRAAGQEVTWDGDFPGFRRVYAHDPFGNRLEFLEPAVVLRPAVRADAEALGRLALRSKGHWGYDAEFLAACRAELTVRPEQCDGVHVVVAERGGALLGFHRLGGEPPVAELADLFVDPAAIGRGLGATLLADAVERARALGMTRLLVDSDPNAEGFYLRMGARRVGTVPSGSIPGRELPRLELDVGPASG
jgi:GNAT superfamily N-acetyltransferase/catechol 2,3-dioxygenase-like lactoylglutathione lyase family enzyme